MKHVTVNPHLHNICFLPYVTLNTTCYILTNISLLYNYFIFSFLTQFLLFFFFSFLHDNPDFTSDYLLTASKCFSNQLKLIYITWFLVFIVTSVIFSGSLNSFVRGV